MRGKVAIRGTGEGVARITPAYAGKRARGHAKKSAV